MKTPSTIDYASAGVNLCAAEKSLARIGPAVQATHTPHVLGGFGGFASMVDLSAYLKAYQNPVLVQSTDGIGTKSRVARLAHCYEHLGDDLLSATANDILVVGAKPLCLLDYYACGQLNPVQLGDIIESLSQACQRHNVALIGGETAEMPHVLQREEFDLAGTITGLIERQSIIDGSATQKGDLLIGLASSGLHTNGYSLARKLCFEIAALDLEQRFEEAAQTRLCELLLAPHRNYTDAVHACLDAGVRPHAMAHITGGGLPGNLSRVVKPQLRAHIELGSWPVPFIFKLLCQLGQLEQSSALSTFNMGIGWVFVIAPGDYTVLQRTLADEQAFVIGTLEKRAANQPAISFSGALL